MMEEQPRKKLAIIDGKSVFYRGYYAMPNLSTRNGTPTGGVFGFATMALEVIKRLKPDYVAVAWDKPKTNIRKRLEIYPAYKAGRKPAPPDFYEQIPVLHQLLDAFGWPLYEMDDYEADDLMGTLARQASEQGIETLLITSDLDALQVVGPLTKVFALKKGLSSIELYSPKSFTAKYQIDVSQFLDFKALKGDSSDNIPGVPGIGEKTAIELLKEHKTLDGIYANLWQIKDSVRKKLEAGKESAYMSKKLGAIWLDAPLELDLDRMDGHHASAEKIQQLLESLEFRSLARQVPEILNVEMSQSNAGLTSDSFKDVNHTIVDDVKKLESLKLDFKSEYVVHSRSKSADGRKPTILSLSPNSKQTISFVLSKLPADKVRQALVGLKSVTGYDVKTTLKVLLGIGWLPTDLPDVKDDVLVGSFVLNSLRRDLSLTDLAVNSAGYDGSGFDDLSDEELVQRAPEIMGVIRALAISQRDELSKTETLERVARTIDYPVIPVLARMEFAGIELDTKYLGSFSDQITDKISDLEQEIYGYADKEFNIASPSQLADILFNHLGLPTQGIKKGKTGYSTAASELDKLRLSHPIINLITQFREVTKLKNTYVDTLPALVDEDSRVHTTFNLTVAQTGRLSSTEPNLQNIPVRTELGKHIRTAFVAAEGKKLVSADYSQFELRLAAAMSGDEEMVSAFNRGADIHTMTAAEVYKRSPEDVTKQMRSAAKTVNFGVLYGMSAHGLVAATGMTYDQAQTFIKQYFDLRAPLLGYLNSLKEQAKQQGYVETLLGRRRPMPDIKSSNFIVRGGAERAAMNMPIQGTEADLMKLAMIAVDKKLVSEFPTASQLLQIHDSILVECDEVDAEGVADLLKTTMESIYPELTVKLDVDTSIGDNWGEL